MPTISKTLSAADLMPDNEQDQRILLARSEHLAHKLFDENELAEEMNYISFHLGQRERYGIPYEVAKEVIHHFTLTKLPLVPNFIAGIINWRGALTAIIDLKKFFNIPNEIVERDKSIIIIESQGMTAGIITDEIDGSLSYNTMSLDPPLPAGAAIKPEYLYGLHKGVIAIINIHAILAEVKSTFLT